MNKSFYKKVEGRTYAAPQYGKGIILCVGNDIDCTGGAEISKEAMAELEVEKGAAIEIIGAWTQTVRLLILDSKAVNTICLNKETRLALPVAIG